MTDQEKFINHIANNYNNIKNKLTMLSARNGYPFDPDAYQESILRCFNNIQKKGYLKDTSGYGIESYLIRSYVNYKIDEARSCKNKKRDKNITSENIEELYDVWYNGNNISAYEKIQRDLEKDYAVLHIMALVEANFDAEHFYLFRLKALTNMTYKQLAEKTKMKNVRAKVVTVKKFLKENLTKEMINDGFKKLFGDIC